MPTPRQLLSLEEYRDEVLALVDPLPSERVDLADGLGRVLRADLIARGDVPAFANSAMDGYAVRWSEVKVGPVTLRVVGDVAAGSGDDPALAPGECVRIMTGAPVPGATDSVVPVELTDEGAEVVTIHELPRQGEGAHVRHAGEDISAGDVVLRSGARLGAAELSAAAGAGHGSAVVGRRPVVGIAATGDELVAPGGDLGRGQIYESNGTHLGAAVVAHGGAARRHGTIRDDVAAFVDALDDLSQGCDLVVLTGGVSVGAYDVARIALEEHAEATFRHVRIQPGKPQGWARWRGTTPVLALPGNPVSAAISFEVFGRPMLERMLGQVTHPSLGRAVADAPWRSPSGRRQLVPVVLRSDEAGVLRAAPAHRRGSASHMVTSLAGAHALATVPEDVEQVAAGDLVEIRSLT